ncbi:pentatricopeptide repeat-containing protein At1g80550, mitochondrial-like [Cornus florida]|uniref:pentatricopeptide repeat-containing protein At1g80550, mitochondrial-like n=1 Tax=Cornus florida TaxID=4283 RepID=UPI0028A1E91B|nr:pentatricopeptide repeat-containing protein At1g80550, mitochondrial-like [Cornus florida]XP_059642196.1 pentatricopeptide repeat-containing protein At1g80550, mitochondrial-like [Cornus florida]XP_059642197.1 pentatricopeptide repeat-containing protein At1g80550, mitochondrial-like [Cornus florida]XP_059642198.1 pentatricopeptide repeat-containing protein At1g80550, mitochondrial-like [Cornus florida]XP_059642199.1 pentatricopeptide repeat-containing protein At1g80550, mitochondrial-like [C
MLSSISYRCHSFRWSQSLLSHIQSLLKFHTFPSTDPSLSTKPSKPSSSSNHDSPKSVLNSMLLNNSIHKQSIAANSLDFDQNTVLETISCYGNDWKRSFEFFNWVETESGFKHSTETYNRMIDILGKFFEFDIAWNLIERMKKDVYAYPDHTTFRIMFKRYVSAHLVNDAISTYDRMEEFNLKDQMSFSNLIDALCEYKHVFEAEELCIKNNNNDKNLLFSANTKIHNMILRGWFKVGWWRKCREFWEEMDRKCVCKDLHSYSIYMDIQCKSGKPWKAVKLYKEMKKKGIELDVVAYNIVIRAIGISDGVDVAIWLFREMIELGCEPNVVTYNTIVKLLCENGRVREAYKVLDQMSKKGCAPNVITYHCLFGYLEKPREILKLFDRMIGSGVCPRMDTYVMLMRKFGRWGFLRPVFIVWKKMEEHGLSPDEFAYNALIDALVQKGMVNMARKYEEEMLAKGLSAKPRAELGTKLVNGESEEG